MHSFLPVTLSHTTFSTVNEIVQKTNRLKDKIVFFFLLSVRWESEAPLKSSSVWRLVVVSRTHCRLCPSAPSLSHCWYDCRGCRKDNKDVLKTKRAPGSLIRHCWAARSSNRKSSQLSISSQKKPCVHGRWNLQTGDRHCFNVENGPLEQRCPCQSLPGGLFLARPSDSPTALSSYWVTVTTQTPRLKTSSSKNSVAFCHCQCVLLRGPRPLQNPSPHRITAIYL